MAKKRIVIAAAALAALLVPALAWAQSSDEDVFSQEEAVSTPAAEADSTAQRNAFFQASVPVILGTYTGTADCSWTWDNPWGGSFSLLEPDSYALNPASNLAIGFSAKPETNLSFYGEVRTSYPFTTQQTAAVTDATGKTIGTTSVTVPDISVFKLYSKFDWNDTVFFSFGKQPLAWGRGYIFTPANDLFDIGAVDYGNLTAEREGPLSLRVNAPLVGNTLTAFLYAVMSSASMDPRDVALGPQLEFSIPGWDFSLSGYYQRESKPAAIASGTWAVGNGLTLFGEGLVSFGSDSWYVVKEERTAPAGLYTVNGLTVPLPAKDFSYRIEKGADAPYLTATAGGIYSKSWEDKLDLSVYFQYLFDGKAQDNLSLNDAAEALVERMDPRYPEADDPSIDATDPTALASALTKFGTRMGRHYGAVSVTAGNLFGSDVSASAFCMANLYDLSGWVKPQVSWQIFDRLSLNFYGMFSFGGPGDEYTNLGGIAKALQGISIDKTTGSLSYTEANLTPTMQLGVSLSLGTGSF